VTSDAGKLARRISYALVQLLPTADWTAEVTWQVARALADDEEQAEILAGQLRASERALRHAGPAQRDRQKAELDDQWRHRIELMLAADQAPPTRAELVLSILQAATGVRGGWRGVAGEPWEAEPADSTRRRRLRCECPESAQVDTTFEVTAQITIAGAGVLLRSFPVPPQGRDVLLDIRAPGLLVRHPHQQYLRVPPAADSAAVSFELRADRPGTARISVTAWLDGNLLGEATARVSVHADRRPPAPRKTASSDLSAAITDGAVSLVVRYEPRDNRYRFQFMDTDNPSEVTAELPWALGPQIDALIRRLDSAARRQVRLSATETRSILADEGAQLWQGIVPEITRRQFWERRDRITQLKVLGDKDPVPWELMYPMDQGLNAGFLIRQFPVTRDVFDRPGLARTLDLRPARFVLPPGSPPAAHREIDQLSELLDAGPADLAAVSSFTSLRELVSSGDFGLLHFACHNNFHREDGSMIELAGTPFTVTNLQAARINKTLRPSAPLVFINACRSAGAAARYNELAGWAEAFLRAGAGAFVGTLWSVKDRSALRFAQSFYQHLRTGKAIGEATMAARQAIAGDERDPTWLAYTVYADPLASLRPAHDR